MSVTLRRLLTLPALFLTANLLVACGPQLVVEQDPLAQLPGAASYAWSTATDHVPGDDNPRVNNDIIAGMVQNAVDTGLAKRGYRQTGKTEAAWLVHYHVGLEKQTQQVTEPVYSAAPMISCGPYVCRQSYGWGFYGPPEAVTRTVTFHEGHLIIDIHDAKTNKLVWRGTVSDEVNVNKAVDPVKLQAAVDKLLAKLPGTPAH